LPTLARLSTALTRLATDLSTTILCALPGLTTALSSLSGPVVSSAIASSRACTHRFAHNALYFTAAELHRHRIGMLEMTAEVFLQILCQILYGLILTLGYFSLSHKQRLVVRTHKMKGVAFFQIFNWQFAHVIEFGLLPSSELLRNLTCTGFLRSLFDLLARAGVIIHHLVGNLFDLIVLCLAQNELAELDFEIVRTGHLEEKLLIRVHAGEGLDIFVFFLTTSC